MSRWRRVEKLPIAYNDDLFAVEQYVVTAISGVMERRVNGASTRDEAHAIAQRLRNSDAEIVTIARVEEAWKRQ